MDPRLRAARKKPSIPTTGQLAMFNALTNAVRTGNMEQVTTVLHSPNLAIGIGGLLQVAQLADVYLVGQIRSRVYDGLNWKAHTMANKSIWTLAVENSYELLEPDHELERLPAYKSAIFY